MRVSSIRMCRTVQTVLVASYRGECAAPPLEVRLVADATQLGRTLDGDDGAHEPD